MDSQVYHPDVPAIGGARRHGGVDRGMRQGDFAGEALKDEAFVPMGALAYRPHPVLRELVAAIPERVSECEGAA
jgi:hypothetical protein